MSVQAEALDDGKINPVKKQVGLWKVVGAEGWMALSR